MAPPLPQLTNNTNRLGGFLPRNLQQKWKKILATHHLIRKTIYIVNITQTGEIIPFYKTCQIQQYHMFFHPTHHTQRGYIKLLPLVKMHIKKPKQ
jgi:hypothetical protein